LLCFAYINLLFFTFYFLYLCIYRKRPQRAGDEGDGASLPAPGENDARRQGRQSRSGGRLGELGHRTPSNQQPDFSRFATTA
jgi:hypothetical protein